MVISGTSEVPLSDDGIREIRETAEGMKAAGIKFSHIYSSPLTRAVHSCSLICEVFGMKPEDVTVDRRLTSLNYGSWEGRTETEVARDEPDRWNQYMNAIDTITFPGGESLSDLSLRATQCMLEIAQRHTGENVLVLTHQVVTRTLLCSMTGLPLGFYWRWGQDVACCNTLQYDGKWWIEQTNWRPKAKVLEQQGSIHKQ